MIATLASLCALALLAFAAPASAAEFPYQLDPELSLTGACGQTNLDPVPDPDCPYPPPPDGPSGRFEEPKSVAIDPYGNEYVASYSELNPSKARIDVFDDEGHFITELADPFGPRSLAVDSKGNLYVFERVAGQPTARIARYSPTVYEPEAGNVEYGNPPVVVATVERFEGGLAIDSSNDHLFIALGVVIKEYSSAAEGNEPLNTIGSGELTSSNWVAVDSQRRRLYASSCRESGILDCVVLVFEADAPHNLIEEIDGSETPVGGFKSGKGWTSIAVDEETGHFFVEDLELTKNVYEFDENYKYVSTLTSDGFEGGNALQIAVSNGEDPSGTDAFNRHYLFVPVLGTAGRVLAFEPPNVLPPEVLEVSVANIDETGAELRATVDPHGGATEYVFEYVSQERFAEEGFTGAAVAGRGTISAASLARRLSAVLSGLTPGTAYRYRLLAKNEAGEAEPIAEGGFATYADALTGALSCPNQSLRVGASGGLPDCRAYELVTPADTNGRPPRGAGFEADRFGTVQSSPAGSALSFEIIGGALPGTEGTGGFHGDLYRADRGPSGWGTVLTGPTSRQATKPEPGSTSPDQGYAFWVAAGEGSAVSESGNRSRHVRYPDGHSEPIGRGSLATDPYAGGRLITENGTHIVFQTLSIERTPIQLEPNAPPTGTRAVYDRTADEVTHVVSLLPGDVPPAAGEHAAYLGASADGEGIAFEIECGGTCAHQDTLYLRKGNATTYEIGKGVTFAGVSAGGERIFYLEGGDLHAFDTASEERIAFTETGDAIPVNVAPQGSRAYFVSQSAIAGSGENPNGAVAQPGEQNLYLSEEGQIGFVATVADQDVEGEANPLGGQINGLGLWVIALAKRQPGIDPSRLTPEGSVLLFQSRASLDGRQTGGDPQVYRYDSAADRLDCLSCIPTGVPEGGGASLMSFAVASNVPPHGTYGFVPNLRADGRRAFFESVEALVSTDNDRARDVYEWEAQGVGSCERAGGCVYLISSGQSSADDYLYAHSATGDDVFFTTADSLTGFDAGGTVSIYDARVNGGFPEPAGPVCDEVDPCRGQAAPAPPFPMTTSEGLSRSQESKPRPRRCPKGKRKVRRNGKVRCVKRQRRANKHRRAGTRRRAAR